MKLAKHVQYCSCNISKHDTCNIRLKHLKHALETPESSRRKIIMAYFQIEVEGKADMWGPKLTCGAHTSVSGGREKQQGYFGTY
jgi:hypothetical protein